MMDSTNVNELVAAARRHQEKGDLELAHDLCGRVLAEQPDRADAWCLSGTLNRSLGRALAAADALRRATELEPDNAQARNMLGVTLAELGRLDDAVLEFQRAIALKPGVAELRCNLGKQRCQEPF